MSKVLAILSSVTLVWALGVPRAFCGEPANHANAAAEGTAVQGEHSDPFRSSPSAFAEDGSKEFDEDDEGEGKEHSKHHHHHHHHHGHDHHDDDDK